MRARLFSSRHPRLLGLLGCSSLVAPRGDAARRRPPAVIGRKVYGQSVAGRPLVAYRLGEPARPGAPTVV